MNTNKIDTTDSKDAAELKLKIANERKLLRTIIDNIPVCVYTKDTDFRKTLVNSYELKQFGWKSEEDVLGKTDRDLFGESVGVNTQKEDEKVMIDGEAILEEEKHIGDGVWAMISKLPLRNDANEITGMVGISVNITERVMHERELTESNERQKEMLINLEKARKVAEKSAKAKEMFLTNMSHEIRTPLNVIIGMIREIGKEPLSESQRVNLKHTEASAYHLLSIINNVLDMSKIEAGEFSLDIKDFSMSAVLSNVQSILTSRAAGKKIKFSVQSDDRIAVALKGDSLRLSQVLINFLGNSIKFTDEGFVKLDVKVMESNSEIQRIRFLISDSGIGMSEDFMQSIFSKFTQENDAANRNYEGTGLGMSISKEIIEMMGGVIQVASKKGEGTQIEVQLNFPIGIEDQLIRIDKSTRNYDISNTRVLVIEDNEMNRFIARQSLKRAKCIITEAENGRQAVEILQNKKFDVILMDVQMPVMDGVEATKIIRTEMNCDTPIIALTANAFKHDIELYLSVGMNDFLIKPYKEEELFSKIETISRTTKPEIKIADDSKADVVSNPNIELNTNKLYNLRQMNVIANGDEKFISSMLSMFRKMALETIERMNTALAVSDVETLKKLAHKIKPSLDNLEIDSLHTEIRTLENYSEKLECDESLKILVHYITDILLKVLEQLSDDNYFQN